jgi:hypothetical protein
LELLVAWHSVSHHSIGPALEFSLRLVSRTMSLLPRNIVVRSPYMSFPPLLTPYKLIFYFYIKASSQLPFSITLSLPNILQYLLREMPKRVKVTSLPEWETLALINSLINLCKNDHVSGFREVLDQNLQENIKELMGRLWILDICKRTKFKIWRTLIYPNTLDPNHLKLSLEDLDKRVSSAWCNNQNANTRAKCVEMLLKSIVATHETWEKCKYDPQLISSISLLTNNSHNKGWRLQ